MRETAAARALDLLSGDNYNDYYSPSKLVSGARAIRRRLVGLTVPKREASNLPLERCQTESCQTATGLLEIATTTTTKRPDSWLASDEMNGLWRRRRWMAGYWIAARSAAAAGAAGGGPITNKRVHVRIRLASNGDSLSAALLALEGAGNIRPPPTPLNHCAAFKTTAKTTQYTKTTNNNLSYKLGTPQSEQSSSL